MRVLDVLSLTGNPKRPELASSVSTKAWVDPSCVVVSKSYFPVLSMWRNSPGRYLDGAWLTGRACTTVPVMETRGWGPLAVVDCVPWLGE
jgi:hypothetical protein